MKAAKREADVTEAEGGSRRSWSRREDGFWEGSSRAGGHREGLAVAARGGRSREPLTGPKHSSGASQAGLRHVGCGDAAATQLTSKALARLTTRPAR